MYFLMKVALYGSCAELHKLAENYFKCSNQPISVKSNLESQK